MLTWGLELANMIFTSTLVFHPSNLPTSKRRVFTSILPCDLVLHLKNVVNIDYVFLQIRLTYGWLLNTFLTYIILVNGRFRKATYGQIQEIMNDWNYSATCTLTYLRFPAWKISSPLFLLHRNTERCVELSLIYFWRNVIQVHSLV